MQRVYTASVIIVFQEKVLLHFHPLFKKWLHIGGHIEANEFPHSAALREVQEETSLAITLFTPDTVKSFSDGMEVIRPIHMITFSFHAEKEALDFLYYAYAHTDVLPVASDTEYRWFSESDLQNIEEWPMPENIRYFALEALHLLK